MKILIKKIHPEAQLPAYAHGPLEDAGLDLRAVERVVLEPGIAQVVPTGIAIELPSGHEAQVRPRSGMALKLGLSVPNAPGTIDADYRGEVKVLLINLGTAPITITRGTRIAQMVFAQVEKAVWREVKNVADLPPTDRGAGGFGSTGH